MRQEKEPRRVMVSGRLPIPLVRQMREVAAQRGMTVQGMLEVAVREFLTRKRGR